MWNQPGDCDVWAKFFVEDGVIRSQADRSYVLCVRQDGLRNGGGVHMWKQAGSADKWAKWDFSGGGIRSKADTDFVLCVRQDGLNNGGGVHMWKQPSSLDVWAKWATPKSGTQTLRCVLTPIVEIRGGSDGFYDKTIKIKVGRSSSQMTTQSLTEVSAKAHGSINTIKFSADASMNSQIKSSVQAATFDTSEERETTEKFHFPFTKPNYVYQATVSAVMSDGGTATFKGTSFIQSPTPLAQTTFTLV